jgi:hypothetical protein
MISAPSNVLNPFFNTKMTKSLNVIPSGGGKSGKKTLFLKKYF